jgi:NADH:ubiquinone oxidoreductase subunit 3 (subunit A)
MSIKVGASLRSYAPVYPYQCFAVNGHRRASTQYYIRSVENMLWTIAVILFVLWALGLATAYTMSGFIHILLVLAIVVVLIRVIQGRRPVL